MKESTLLKIALISAILGTAALYFIAGQIEVNEKSIDKITSDYIQSDVKIIGHVMKISETDKVAYVDVAQPKSISVVVFKDGKLQLKENDYIEVTGMVEEYEGNLQLIANEIKVK